MAKEKSKKNEEELERRRIGRKEKYKRIKNDPEKYAIERAKKKGSLLKEEKSIKKENVKRLADVKFDWTNQKFIKTQQKVSGGHEEAFLRFINEGSFENITEKE